MNLVLDTNAYCLCDTGHKEALARLEQAQRLFLPVVVYGELYYGFKYGARFAANLARLDKFIDSFGVEMIEVNVDVSRKFGDIFALLRRKGVPIPTNDIWISASCLHAHGTLLTTDRHFLNVEQIQVEFLADH